MKNEKDSKNNQMKSKSKEVLLSIVIPTRNRDIYCIEAIIDVLSYSRTDFELVVQDNSDETLLEDYVKTLSDNRLIYSKIKGRINSVVNMDMAIAKSSGKYVTMIGDDDTILPSIFDVVDWMDSNYIDSVSTSLMPTFLWNINCEQSKKMVGQLILFPYRNLEEKVDPKIELKKLLNDGLIGYSNYKLPKVYHGILKREILTKIKDKTGHFIGGLSPDIYLAISTSLLVQNFHYLHFPISIAGVCQKSTSFDGLNKLDLGLLESAPHLYKRGEYLWSNLIPRIYTSTTLWADSGLKALEEMGADNYYSLFNSHYFSTVFKLNHNELIKEYPQLFSDFDLKFSYYNAYKYLRNKYYKKMRSLYWRLSMQYKKFDNVNSWKEVNIIMRDK